MPHDSLAALEARISDLNAQALMREGMLYRTIFRDARRRSRDRGWVRVRLGDVDLDNKSRCRLTYKLVENVNESKMEREIDLRVESYDECIELLSRIGLEEMSRQETRRTKFLCTYGELAYVINIDTWPWLDKLRFVSIQPIEGVSGEPLADFCAYLGLKQHPDYTGGVDSVYRRELGFAVSSIRDVRFGTPVPKPKQSKPSGSRQGRHYNKARHGMRRASRLVSGIAKDKPGGSL